MPKAIVVEDQQIEYLLKFTKSNSGDNCTRNVALILTSFGTGMTVTEICRLQVKDYLQESGDISANSSVRAEIAFNNRSRCLYWKDSRLTSAIDAHLSERITRGHGVSDNRISYRGLDPNSSLFVSARTGRGFKVSAIHREGKTYYAANQLVRLFTQLFEQAGFKGASSHSGRRTLAVKLKRRGIDLRHIGELLGVETRHGMMRLTAGCSVNLDELVKFIF